MRLLAAAAVALALAGPAAAADRQVYFGDAFGLEAADPGPFDRLPDGRLACLSDACANRVVSVGGVTVQVLPRVTAKEVAARRPAYRAETAVGAAPADRVADELLFGAAAVLALCAAALAAAELRGRRQAPVDRLRRALRLVRESAARAPGDRRRALDHLAATLGDDPPAEQATQLAWSRPDPDPEPTLRLADEVAAVRKPIPYGELGAVAGSTRRTLALRALLGAAAVAAAVVVVLLGRGEEAPAGPLPAGTDGLVVLDLSASISTDTYARIGATLDELADTDGRYGLIVFSDTAYLALPPGTPASELREFARRFEVPAQTGGAITVPTNPWTNSFSAGTKISTGLQLALDTIAERRLGRPAVLLVSDLDDDVGDLERLTSTALAFRRLEIPVRVVALNAAPEDERYVARLLPRSSDLSAAPLPGEDESSREDVSLALFLAALAAAAVLALRELLVTRVERA